MNQNKKFPRLEVHIVNHCNLNCYGCAHFSNICNEFYLNISQFEKDLFEITNKIEYELINILGGEPLLHPNLEKFFYSARSICKNQTITITTNGIMLSTLSENIWEAMKVNNIEVRLSAYPPTINNIKDYINLIRSKNINIFDIWDGRRFHLRKNSNRSSDKNLVWENCDAKICHQLYLGKIYPCSFDAYGKFYNKFFNTEFYFDDGIDIYKNTKEAILEYLTNPVRNCSNCSQNGRIIKWRYSNLQQDEWDI